MEEGRTFTNGFLSKEVSRKPKITSSTWQETNNIKATNIHKKAEKHVP
jgi:hypothetical protein